ncbi:ABC transporter permease [Paenibacillus sp. BAC0078]
MRIRRSIKLAVVFVLIFIISWVVFNRLIPKPTVTALYINMQSNTDNQFQIYYSQGHNDFTEDRSTKRDYRSSSNYSSLKLDVNSKFDSLRLDLGNHPGKLNIKKIYIGNFMKKYELPLDSITNVNSNEIKNFQHLENNIEISTSGADPYIYLSLDKTIIRNIGNDNQQLKYFIIACFSFVASIICCLTVYLRKKIFGIFKDFRTNRALIYDLSKNDFKTKYAGSYLGVVWGYIQPVTTILVYWFVFQVGLKVTPTDSDVPFAVWFIGGLIPWFFFSDALSNASNSFVEYSFLVKKLVFKVSILPIVKIISSLFVHLVFIAFLYIVYLSYGYHPHVYNLQILYYSVCTLFFTTALSYLTSSIVVFFKDLGQIIAIFLQVGMWITPIMWSEKILSDSYSWIFKLNPMYYVVDGYRDSMFKQVWFTEHIYLTLYFWLVTFLLFLLGTYVFRRLKPHFADVL